MKSGLEGRNNALFNRYAAPVKVSLNEVRPRRPEQYEVYLTHSDGMSEVSMKSGLEGRNNSGPVLRRTWAFRESQ